MPPTDHDLQQLRHAFDEFNERYAELKSGGLRDYFERFYTEDAVVESPDAFPVPAGFSGYEGYEAWFDDAYGGYDRVGFEVERIDAVGERLVARALVRGTPSGDTIEFETRVGLVYDMRAGRISRVQVFLSHDRALEAAR